VKNLGPGLAKRHVERTEALIALGHNTARCANWQTQTVPVGDYQEWRLASLSFLETAVGAENRYFKHFDRAVGEFNPLSVPLKKDWESFAELKESLNSGLCLTLRA